MIIPASICGKRTRSGDILQGPDEYYHDSFWLNESEGSLCIHEIRCVKPKSYRCSEIYYIFEHADKPELAEKLWRHEIPGETLRAMTRESNLIAHSFFNDIYDAAEDLMITLREERAGILKTLEADSEKWVEEEINKREINKKQREIDPSLPEYKMSESENPYRKYNIKLLEIQDKYGDRLSEQNKNNLRKIIATLEQEKVVISKRIDELSDLDMDVPENRRNVIVQQMLWNNMHFRVVNETSYLHALENDEHVCKCREGVCRVCPIEGTCFHGCSECFMGSHDD